jgi:Contractile injection system tube protein/LysM domain
MAALNGSAGSAAATGTPEGFTKAKLNIDSGPTLECYFNPTEYSISKSNEWKYKSVTGTSFSPPEFGGGQPRQIELSLLFDQTFPPYTMSVRESTAALLDMMEVPSGKTGGSPTAVPPFVTFEWGRLVFKGACVSLSVTYKLFEPNGDPLRADVKLTLKQAEEAQQGQNPTTRATAGYGVHRVRDGDTLPSISYQAYGDATKWRLIAEANGVDNPLHLRRGRALSLPRLDG